MPSSDSSGNKQGHITSLKKEISGLRSYRGKKGMVLTFFPLEIFSFFGWYNFRYSFPPQGGESGPSSICSFCLKRANKTHHNKKKHISPQTTKFERELLKNATDFLPFNPWLSNMNSASVAERKEKDFFSFRFPLLATERAALGESGLATSGLAQNSRAAGADNDGLGV
jgi:hypothetical protein